MGSEDFQSLKQCVSACKVCALGLPNPPKPIFQFSPTSKILIIGQAPGRLAHESGIPWSDPSGERLRDWLGLSDQEFYDPSLVALVPMGFCFPGTGKSGDLPPRKECAPKWHLPILKILPENRLTLLVGSYAQAFYLPQLKKKKMAERVITTQEADGELLALPHPSWRVAGWMKNNAWFEAETLFYLRQRVNMLVKGSTL